MIRAVIVDRDYGSVSLQKQYQTADGLAGTGIELELRQLDGEDSIISGCRDADVILATGNPPITEKVLSALPRLKMVSRFGVGYNSIDLEACTRHGVVVTYMPGFCAHELAEHAAALILGLMRNLRYYDSRVRAGEWPKCEYYVPQNLHSSTLGLVGFGAAARQMAAVFGYGFGSRVLAYDPYVAEDEARRLGAEPVSFDRLIGESDIISIHVPLTSETKNLFDYDVFRRMKCSAMVVNVSRGGIINESDLVRALENREIRYAGLDVFEREPIQKDSPLLGMDNVLLTPHSASYGEESGMNQVSMAVDTLKRAFCENMVSPRIVANKSILSADCVFRFK